MVIAGTRYAEHYLYAVIVDVARHNKITEGAVASISGVKIEEEREQLYVCPRSKHTKFGKTGFTAAAEAMMLLTHDTTHKFVFVELITAY